jgi:hypothetical protein
MLLANLLQSANDDQVALVGGLAAMFVAGGVMYFSYFLGPEARKQRMARRAEAIRPMNAPSPLVRDRAA